MAGFKRDICIQNSVFYKIQLIHYIHTISISDMAFRPAEHSYVHLWITDLPLQQNCPAQTNHLESLSSYLEIQEAVMLHLVDQIQEYTSERFATNLVFIYHDLQMQILDQIYIPASFPQLHKNYLYTISRIRYKFI